jgi:hypothetical protein
MSRKPYSKPRMWWDPQRKIYFIKTSFNQDFVADLKLYTDISPRWDGELKLWIVDEADEETAIGCIQKHFPGEMEFIKKPDETAAAAAVLQGKLTGAAGAALTMFMHAGKDSAKDVYSILCKRHHSDLHPDWTPEEKAKHDPICAAITVAYRELKSHMGW